MLWDSPTAADVRRLVTVIVNAETTNVTAVAHGITGIDDVQVLRLGPDHVRDRLAFSDTGKPRGTISFELNTNDDLSITAKWTAQEIDDEVESEVSGTGIVLQDHAKTWRAGRVGNPDPIDSDWTDFSFTILNKVDAD